MAATPRRETTDAARDTVFNTPKLLENIISCLPPRDILTVVQRLSHRWADAVDSSPTIKSKLGSRSHGVMASRPARFIDLETFRWRPDWAAMALPMYPSGLTLNPNFYDKTLHGVHMRWEEGSPFVRVIDDMGASWSLPTLCLGAYLKDEYKQPSFGPTRTWRDMYLTQPPITTGILKLFPGFEYQRNSSPIVFVTVRDHSGITLGLLHDTISASLGSKFRNTMGSDHVNHFSAQFVFASKCENLSQQCLQTIFEQ